MKTKTEEIDQRMNEQKMGGRTERKKEMIEQKRLLPSSVRYCLLKSPPKVNASTGPKTDIHATIPETQTAQSLPHGIFDHSGVSMDTHDTVPKTETAQIRPHKIVIA